MSAPRTISRLRAVASAGETPRWGCTNGSAGNPVEVTRRTVSPYCRIDSTDPDQVVCPASRGVAGSVTSRSNRSVLVLPAVSDP